MKCEHPSAVVERTVLESFAGRCDLCRCWSCGKVWAENVGGPVFLTRNVVIPGVESCGLHFHVQDGWHLMNRDGGGI